MFHPKNNSAGIWKQSRPQIRLSRNIKDDWYMIRSGLRQTV